MLLKLVFFIATSFQLSDQQNQQNDKQDNIKEKKWQGNQNKKKDSSKEQYNNNKTNDLKEVNLRNLKEKNQQIFQVPYQRQNPFFPQGEQEEMDFNDEIEAPQHFEFLKKDPSTSYLKNFKLQFNFLENKISTNSIETLNVKSINFDNQQILINQPQTIKINNSIYSQLIQNKEETSKKCYSRYWSKYIIKQAFPYMQTLSNYFMAVSLIYEYKKGNDLYEKYKKNIIANRKILKQVKEEFIQIEADIPKDKQIQELYLYIKKMFENIENRIQKFIKEKNQWRKKYIQEYVNITKKTLQDQFDSQLQNSEYFKSISQQNENKQEPLNYIELEVLKIHERQRLIEKINYGNKNMVFLSSNGNGLQRIQFDQKEEFQTYLVEFNNLIYNQIEIFENFLNQLYYKQSSGQIFKDLISNFSQEEKNFLKGQEDTLCNMFYYEQYDEKNKKYNLLQQENSDYIFNSQITMQITYDGLYSKMRDVITLQANFDQQKNELNFIQTNTRIFILQKFFEILQGKNDKYSLEFFTGIGVLLIKEKSQETKAPII